MPTVEDLRKLVGLIRNSSDTEYVFSKLQSVDWVPLLISEGLFSSPYKPIPEGEGFLLPTWPQSRFLARLARRAQPRPNQETLLKAVLSIPETPNVRIHADLVDVALGLDPDLAARLVPLASRWVASSFRIIIPMKLGELISHLARGGQVGPALALAKAVLEIKGDGREGEAQSRLVRDPIPQFDVWDYEQVLARNVPDLVAVGGERTLDMLCEILDSAILVSRPEGSSGRPHDQSNIWRAAIEDNYQNFGLGVRHLLVNAVRDAAIQVARRDDESATAVIRMFLSRGRSWDVFHRIALYLLRLFPGSDVDLLRAELVSRENFESIEIRHEYFLLEQECFGRLTGEEQRLILGWIDEGPHYTDEQVAKWEEFTGRKWTDEDKARYVRHWKRDRLAPLAGHLAGEWRRTYDVLVSEVGPPQHPEFTSYHEGGTRGPASPSNREDLAKLSTAALVSYLLDWEPTDGGFFGPTPEGLGRELTEVIVYAPEKYAKDIVEFERLSEPTYARAIVQGFVASLKAKRIFPWSPVLDLCSWVVAQPREIPGRVIGSFERDPHWGWARSAVSRLLMDGFESKENPIPYDLRERVWPRIEANTHDPDPSLHDEMEYWGDPLQSGDGEVATGRSGLIDPFTNSLNTARGVALEAVIRYALWVRRGLEESGKSDLIATGFGAMPEVREVLDFHLDATNDSSLTIRSVYGYRAPWLQLLDVGWAEENTARIFSAANPALWHAAWDTYIGYSQPYDKVFGWLKDQYAYATGRIGSHTHPWAKSGGGVDCSLANHLMAFLWRGALEYESDIISEFYRLADTKLRGNALSFIGRSLRNERAGIPEDVSQRLKSFWERRRDAVKSGPAEGTEELRQFGWWFTSGKMEDDWSVRQLLEALRLTRSIEPDFFVVETLANVAPSMPSQCVEALALIVKGDTKGWGVRGWSDNAKAVIRAALNSGNKQARERAEDLVNLLGSRGYFDFGDLLKE